jgi:hypothetical protein
MPEGALSQAAPACPALEMTVGAVGMAIGHMRWVDARGLAVQHLPLPKTEGRGELGGGTLLPSNMTLRAT